MKKMTIPPHDAIATYDVCVQAVGDAALRERFSDARPGIVQANAMFENASNAAAWANLPRLPRGNSDALVAGEVRKRDMMDLYSSHMVDTAGPSRTVYDELLTAAGGLCPFCGGLGHAWTLDHYLPKANFPAYSVHPQNLVPCCRDCNTGKNSTFGQQVHEQTLHPYLDQLRFFDERWITGEVVRCDPILIRYQCTPPGHWTNPDQERVRNHFGGYALAKRFSVQAGSEISKVVQLRQGSLSGLSPQAFREYLLENANCPDFVLNGWSRTMYAALADSDWFAQTDFNAAHWHL